ncbi:MAG: substrate-binding domain-containing protein [Treponema sp.]|jgi:ribose transport system substrate-binding protein|nr:substrate-binding domain-containing protein [Treponema sp.]
MKRKAYFVTMTLLLTGLCCLMTACGNQNTAAAESGENPNFVGDPQKEFYMVTFLSGYPFWENCFRGFKDAGDLYGVKTIYAGATEYDVNLCVTAFDQIIAKKPAGIAVTAMDAEAYIPSINRAMEQGIPIITFDSDSPNSKRISYIGTDNYSAGAEAARYIGDKLNGRGKIAVITSLGQTNMVDRTNGFVDTIKNSFAGIEIVQVVDGGPDQIEATNSVANLVKAHRDIDYLFCISVSYGIGAVTALQEAGLSARTRIVSTDTDDVTLDAIKAGEIEATVTQGPWCEGFWAMNVLYFIDKGLISSSANWLKDGYPSIPINMNSGASMVTKDNVDIFYVQR